MNANDEVGGLVADEIVGDHGKKTLLVVLDLTQLPHLVECAECG